MFVAWVSRISWTITTCRIFFRQVLKNAGGVDDSEFDWVGVGEERLRKLKIRLPPGPLLTVLRRRHR